ncbi:phosphatidylinositol kinase [Halarcobacter mediterraneus]|uniref:Phosphatidylinositol kinase n=1 Tax=Halarcobacter mediterraneus TaxID=2023153 RepID=A0A4V1M1K6_9BACT|nr:HipA domain-containing protein [Halarcobacter mediterraneus]RXK14206.1 phosphatidylinositol kinase [Halarcobacter mediterraneus]
MADIVHIYLFEEHIADLYIQQDKIFLSQIEQKAHNASPISISKNTTQRETSNLKYLEGVPGFVSDSLPGNFGTKILNEYFLDTIKAYPTIVDKLLFIGDNGLGALSYKPNKELKKEDEQTIQLKEMFEKAKELKKGGNFHSIHSAFLVSAHSFVGGARSKAVAAINLDTKEIYLGKKNEKIPKGFLRAIIKYDDTAHGDENKSTYSKLEYIYYLLTKDIGLNMSECHLVESEGKHHFVTKRFDIEDDGTRYHVHSLAGLLEIDYNEPRLIGYEELLRTAIKLNVNKKSLAQLVLQMLFNYMFVNQDDHARNFSFMCDKSFKWRATPAYDITFAKGIKQTLEHQLSLYGKALSTITLDDVVQLCVEFDIDLEFVSDKLELMKKLREEKLPKLLEEYQIKQNKKEQVLNEVSKRDLQGELR